MKTELHPRNRHRGLYNFEELIQACHDLAKFVRKNPYGNESIDFTDPIAVKTLNKALLKSFYNIIWELPQPFLCPPIPSRADYIHAVADLLSESNSGIAPLGKTISILDIGVGANCIYPLLGTREYGWHFVGTEIDPLSLTVANGIIAQNELTDSIQLRLQTSPSSIFKGVTEDSVFHVSMCNPPFHASESEATAGSKRKWKNLEKKTDRLNFGGKSTELWCLGGEVGFIKQMIRESVDTQCGWFTTLVSKESSLPAIYRALDEMKASEVRTIPLGQGQKKSRIIAWTFGHSSL